MKVKDSRSGVKDALSFPYVLTSNDIEIIMMKCKECGRSANIIDDCCFMMNWN
jgi:hypothetical protein